MANEGIDEALLLNYLLGSLREEEQVEVEDRAFSDAEYRSALESAETDLIDSYVRGELSSSDRRKFERQFLKSPQRRTKVEFAKALAEVTAEFKPSRHMVPERLSIWQVFLNLASRFHPAVQLAGGMAALLVIAAAAWLGVQNSALRSRVAALQAQRVELEDRARTLGQQLSGQQARATDADTQKTPAGAERPPLIASLFLLPGLSRAESQVQEITLTRQTQLVHIEIQLEPPDEFPHFRAELHTRGDEDVLIRSGLTMRRDNGGSTVSFEIPASAVPAGEYELALKGLSDGQTTDVGYYYFRVRKQ